MTKDEALDLALEALEYIYEGANNQGPHTGISWRCVAVKAEPAITAIKQALALDKKAENARELGLDYEPAGLIARLTHPEQHYEYTDPKKANAVLMSLCQEAADALAAQHEPENEPYVSLASVQERTDYAVHLNHCNIGECEGVCKYLDDDCPALKHADMKAKWDRPTPQRQWVGLTVLEQADCFANTEDATEFYHAIEAKLKEKNT
jgi:hypothetical protein